MNSAIAFYLYIILRYSEYNYVAWYDLLFSWNMKTQWETFYDLLSDILTLYNYQYNL